MFIERAFKRPAILCALLLALCTLATYPFVEMGGNDDFAYVRSAKALADTGHVVFFGWSSTMLGWQLALGALFIKLFGFSFTVTRVSILLVALCLTFLLQRTLVRLGLNETNAAFATLTLVLSPLFIPLSFSFMADIPGLLAIVLCLYLCLRAIQAPRPSQTNAWLIAAAVSSALLGTARQTGWLGVLVIVPSTCWLLRRRHLSLLVAFVWGLCVLFIFAALHWFSHQMYTTAESFDGTAIDQGHLFNMALAGLRGPLQTAFFLSPIFIAFALAFLKTRNRWVYLSLAAAIVFCAYLCLRPHSYWVGIVLAPASSGIGNYVTSRGILELPAIGNRPLVLNFAVRVVITVVSYFAAFAFLVLLITRRNRRVQAPEAMTSELSWQQLFLLLGPFTLAYSVFLAFRVFSGVMFDRYLLPLFMVLAVVALRFYQERISPRLPRTCFAVLFLFAAFGVAGTHDMFAEDRARLAAIEQLRAAGLPPTAFYAGFAYDGWTQIDTQGYIDANGIHTPTGIRHLPKAKRNFDNPCYYWAATFYPAIKPQYVISYDDFSCGNSDDRFAPVSYRLWLPPFSGALYSRSVTPELLSQSGKESAPRR